MQVNTIGKYVMLMEKSFRSSNSVFTIPVGTVINVSQIDYKNDKFYSDELGDWQYWEQPFKPLDEVEYNRLTDVYKLQ